MPTLTRCSGGLGSGDPVDRPDEVPPFVTLRGKHLPAVGGQPVVASPPLSGFLDPAAIDPAALLQPVEEGIERGDVEAQRALGARLDEFVDFVAVPVSFLDQGENQQLGTALLQFAV